MHKPEISALAKTEGAKLKLASSNKGTQKRKSAQCIAEAFFMRKQQLGHTNQSSKGKCLKA